MFLSDSSGEAGLFKGNVVETCEGVCNGFDTAISGGACNCETTFE